MQCPRGARSRAVGFELPEVEEPGTKEIPDIVLDEPVTFVVILRGPGGALRDDGKVSAARSEFPSYSRRGNGLRLREQRLEAERRGPGEHVFERASRGSGRSPPGRRGARRSARRSFSLGARAE